MTVNEAIEYIESGRADGFITENLGISKEKTEFEKSRITNAVECFSSLYGDNREIGIFSVGGRSEISGNHTDHNAGRVIAACVNLSVIAVASPRTDGIIRMKSEGFDEDVVTPFDAEKPTADNYFKSSAIIAGIENAFIKNSLNVGGFDAYTVSSVPTGSGLSSSAAFEVTVAKILSSFYNGDTAEEMKLAEMSQYAENVFFGKPCGLMDQASCAVGGLITVDFENPSTATFEKLDFDFEKEGYGLCIINTGASHADLNGDYAAVPIEMKKTAELLGVSVLRETTKENVIGNASLIRREAGDRALLRAFHFFDENERVVRQTECAKRHDMNGFLRCVRSSGNSSYKYLQNVFSPSNPREEGVALALYLADGFLGEKGAVRVHGGGFAGTVQAFVPLDICAAFKEYTEHFFGKGSCLILSVRKSGAERII